MTKDMTVSTYSLEPTSIHESILALNTNDNANKTSAGFIYQDLVLMKNLLYLENDSTVIGYEVLDDIHIIKENSITLIQVKHSINDSPLTESSIDFWKTINKWAKIPATNHDEKLKFVFYTNRPIAASSNLYNELQKENKDYASIETILNDLFNTLEEKEKKKATGQAQNPIFDYVKKINSLTLDDKKTLFEKLTFSISDKQIVDEIKMKLQYFGISKRDEIDRVYENLLGIITDKRYHLAREGEDFLIDYNYFRIDLKFDSLLKLARYDEIDFDKYYNFSNQYDENYHDKIFYKQLKDIDIQDSDIKKYARERAKASSFFKELDLIQSEEKIIYSKIYEEWENIHEDIYDEAINNEAHHKSKARDCLKNTKNTTIVYKTSSLPKSLIKGKMIDLSNVPIIGWKKDWKEQYHE